MSDYAQQILNELASRNNKDAPLGQAAADFFGPTVRDAAALGSAPSILRALSSNPILALLTSAYPSALADGTLDAEIARLRDKKGKTPQEILDQRRLMMGGL